MRFNIKVIRVLFLLVCCGVITSAYSSDIATLKKQLKTVSTQIKKSPDDANLKWKKYLLNYQLGEQTKKRKYFKAASVELEQLQKTMPLNPNISSGLYKTYSQLLYLGQRDVEPKVVKLFNQLLPDYRQNLAPPSMTLFWGGIDNPKFFDINKLSEKEQTQHYINLLSSAIKEQPNFVGAYTSLAYLYGYDGHYLPAQAVLERALKKFPDNTELLKSLGSIYIDKSYADGCPYNDEKDINSAKIYSLKALKLAPKDAEVHFNLARVYEASVNLNLAINEMRTAYRLSSDSDYQIYLADLLLFTDLDEEALGIFKQQIKKGNAAARYSMANGLIVNGRFAEAESSLKLNRYSSAYDYLKKGLIKESLNKKKGLAHYAKLAQKQSELSQWESSLLAFILNEISFEEVINKSETECEELEAHFYHGYKAYFNGNQQTAKTFFEKVRAYNFPSFYEHQMSLYFSGLLN